MIDLTDAASPLCPLLKVRCLGRDCMWFVQWGHNPKSGVCAVAIEATRRPEGQTLGLDPVVFTQK